MLDELRALTLCCCPSSIVPTFASARERMDSLFAWKLWSKRYGNQRSLVRVESLHLWWSCSGISPELQLERVAHEPDGRCRVLKGQVAKIYLFLFGRLKRRQPTALEPRTLAFLQLDRQTLPLVPKLRLE